MHSIQKYPKIFYGWWVVGACFLIAIYTGGVVFFGFTAVFEPIANEFGWSYTQVSLAASLRGLEVGLLAPLSGLLVDRWGPRKLTFGGVFAVGLGLLLLSRINSLGMFYATFVLISVGLSTCSVTVLMAAVVNWFRKKVALAIGITISGFGIAGLLVSVVTILVDTLGWRTAMVSLGLGMWLVGFPLSLLLRHKPEQYGYLPDGETSSTEVNGADIPSVQSTEVEIQVKQALKSRTFWHISLALLCHSLVMSAVLTHVMPYLSSVGITRSISSLVASITPVASVFGRLGFGWLGNRINIKRLAATGLALVSLGLIFFGYVPDGGIWMLLPYILFLGTGWGGIATMRSILIWKYFGRSKFGTIHGFAVGIMMLGHMGGAPLAGWVFDNWGSYQGIWFVFAGLSIVAVSTMLTTTDVKHKKPPVP